MSKPLSYPTSVPVYSPIPNTPNFTEYVQPNKQSPFEQVNINPHSFEVPKELPAYRHPNHEHLLYCVFGQSNRQCDNASCKKHIDSHHIRFCCMQCDFDLCTKCFQYYSASQQINVIPTVPKLTFL